MQINVVAVAGGQAVDVIAGETTPPSAGALLLHGSGAAERLSLRSLAVELASRGIVAVVPDWHPNDDTSSLGSTLAFADEVLTNMKSPQIDGPCSATWREVRLPSL